MDWIVTLFLIALVLFFFEIILPGGILFIIGMLLLLVATGIAYFEYGSLAALGVFVGSGMLAFLMLILELKVLPKTWIGRRFFLRDEIEGGSLKTPPKETLIGQEGETITVMAPSGKVRIAGQLLEGFSQNGHLDKGIAVQVIGTDPFRVIVRKK